MLMAIPKTEWVTYNVLVSGEDGNLLGEICVICILCDVWIVLNDNMLQRTYIRTVYFAR